MRASLDTNVIIHLYRAEQQDLLFRFFYGGLLVYEQIRYVELVNHGKAILDKFDSDIAEGRIILYTDLELKKQGVFRIFEENVRDNRMLYGSGDLGEVYAISLAQTLGAYALVTDDIKQGGPYMSLLQFPDSDVMPFSCTDLLILCYLEEDFSEEEVIKRFDAINANSQLCWSFQSHLKRFIMRFWSDAYQEQEKQWMQKFCEERKIKAKGKLLELRKILK